MIDHQRIVFADQVFVRRPYFSAAAYKTELLKEVLGTNVFKNALWLASPEFYRELEKKDFDCQLLSKKERLTALKFYNRMSFRATPFGAFAAFGLAAWGDGSRQKMPEAADMCLHLLPSVVRELDDLKQRTSGEGTLLAVNPTLYRMASGWRYSRYETEKNGKLSFFSYLLEYSEADAMLLEYLGDKSLAVSGVLSYLEELTGCTGEEGRLHLERLLEEQVLIKEDIPALLLDTRHPGLWSNAFNEQFSLPAAMALRSGGAGFRDDGRSFYAGLEMLGDVACLNESWKGDISEALGVLDLLSVIPPTDALDKFRQAFERKFGERRVPLLEALDPDLGVAYDGLEQMDEHELLQGLEFQRENRRTDQLTWTPVHRLFMKIWLQNSKRETYDPVLLDKADLAGLTAPALPVPPGFSVICSVATGKLILQSAGGVTANALSGRFSAFSERFRLFCENAAQQEAAANPDMIMAEILQYSHNRIDNINRRRRVYEKVIPLNTFPVAGSLLPKDLELFVKAGEVILLHRPSGKRVIPRLPTAFNFHHNEMLLFRFLCDLQFQGVRANLDFDPEKLFPGLNFYPRVEYGRVVLSLARWHLRREDIDDLLQLPLSISRLHLFCREKGMPVRIAAGRGDQQLVFDLSNDDEALFFLESLHDASNSVITEYPEGRGGVRKNNDGFALQFVASLFNPGRVYSPLLPAPDEKAVIRDFAPGSEWVYLKIYATPRSADYLLLHVLLPWAEKNRDRVKQWFFVRFHDPDSHLRIRFRVDALQVKDVQYELQSLVSRGPGTELVQKAYFDTYQREIERYTPGLINLVEDVFYRGSEAICRYLFGQHAGPDDEEPFWPVWHCYRVVTVFFKDDLAQVIQLCKWAAEAYFAEHGGDKKLKRSMDDKFRVLRPVLMERVAVLDESNTGPDAFFERIKTLCYASSDLAPLSRQKLIADMVHMQVNRIFLSGQRKQEAFIWHCLLKLAVSAAKRGMKVPAEDLISGR
jgi:thiopeptide-type bacteriocin biosynthesis protein